MLTGDYRHRDHGHNESKVTLDVIKSYHILQSNATARRLTSADLPHIHKFAHLLLKINKDGKLIAGKDVLNQIGRNRGITIIKDPTIETKTKPVALKTASTATPTAGAASVDDDTTLSSKGKTTLDPTVVTSPPPAALDDDTVYDVVEATDEELAQMLQDLQQMTGHAHEGPKKAKDEHVSKISSSAQQVFKGKVAFVGKNQESRAQEQIQAERSILQQQSADRARERQKKLQQKRAEKNEQDELKAAEKNKEADKFDDKRAQIKKDDIA